MNQDKMIRLFLEEQKQKVLRPSEIAALAQSLSKNERAAAEARRRGNLKKGAAPPEGETFPVRGRSLDRIGKHFNVSGRTLRKIVEMAEGGFAREMDAAGLGRVDRAYRKFRRAQAARAAQGQVDMPLADDDLQIFQCRFQELEQIAGIKPASAQLFVADIPYAGAFLPQVCDLGQLAARLLVEGGLLVLYSGQAYLNRVMASLDQFLSYRWALASVWDGDATIIFSLQILSKTKPILLYSKGAWQKRGLWPDVLRVNSKEKDLHDWQQPLEEAERLVRYFSQPGDLVIDPCGGSFTTAEASCASRASASVATSIPNAWARGGTGLTKRGFRPRHRHRPWSRPTQERFTLKRR
jgi:hypothetical protein